MKPTVPYTLEVGDPTKRAHDPDALQETEIDASGCWTGRADGDVPHEPEPVSKKPNVSNIRVFGCDVFVHVPKELRRKLDDKASYLVWDPEKQTIATVRDVEQQNSSRSCLTRSLCQRKLMKQKKASPMTRAVPATDGRLRKTTSTVLTMGKNTVKIPNLKLK